MDPLALVSSHQRDCRRNGGGGVSHHFFLLRIRPAAYKRSRTRSAGGRAVVFLPEAF